MSEMEDIRKKGDENFEISKRLLGDTFTVADDINDLYRVLVEISTKSPLMARDEYVAALHFLVGSQYHLAMSVLAALRGHIIDALRDTRLAIELAAFAARVKRKPALAVTWLDAGTADAAYAAYRKEFRTSQLFPPGQRQWRDLNDRYDFTAKLSHPSVYKMAGHTRIERTPTTLNIGFHYFQLRNNDASEPTRTFLWILDTHVKLIRVFEDVLAQVLKHDRARWDMRFATIDAKLDGHKEKWRSVCVAPARRSARDRVIIPRF